MNFSAELTKLDTDSTEYKIFQKIFEKIGPDFIRTSVTERQREVHSKLNEAKEEYFQKHILTNAIFKSLEGYKSQEANNEASSQVHSFYLNMAKSYLPPERSHNLKLFGLNQDQVLKALENQKPKTKNAVFQKLVEDNIDDFCKKLISCTGEMILPGEDWQKAFDRTMKDLESKVTLVSSQETREKLRKKQLREMIKTYYEELSRGVSLLGKALSLIEQQLEFESDLSECYHIRCHAVSLKLKYCELKILQHTYNQETMPALKKISIQLHHSEQKLAEDYKEKTVALESYLKLGQDYEQLVDEYTNLIKSIKEQQWAIDELKSKESQYGASSCK